MYFCKHGNRLGCNVRGSSHLNCTNQKGKITSYSRTQLRKKWLEVPGPGVFPVCALLRTLMHRFDPWAQMKMSSVATGW